MHEFELINTFFKSIPHRRPDVLLGIGDDAACVQVPPTQQLVISTDTLVAGVHFHPHWDAYDMAYKAVMVNVSDMAAMAATPTWVTLALTLPSVQEDWLERFTLGLREALMRFNLALIGGDTTHGPLSMTLTIHGLVPCGYTVTRSYAKPGDKIYVSGPLGGAAYALQYDHGGEVTEAQAQLLRHLHAPNPRVDLSEFLRASASAAIDISDGLSGDLQHICCASQVGACLDLTKIPLHPLIQHDLKALDFALYGGDDYELCFTIPPNVESRFLTAIEAVGLNCYEVGLIESQLGLRAKTQRGEIKNLNINSYQHF